MSHDIETDIYSAWPALPASWRVTIRGAIAQQVRDLGPSLQNVPADLMASSAAAADSTASTLPNVSPYTQPAQAVPDLGAVAQSDEGAETVEAAAAAPVSRVDAAIQQAQVKAQPLPRQTIPDKPGLVFILPFVLPRSVFSLAYFSPTLLWRLRARATGEHGSQPGQSIDPAGDETGAASVVDKAINRTGEAVDTFSKAFNLGGRPKSETEAANQAAVKATAPRQANGATGTGVVHGETDLDGYRTLTPMGYSAVTDSPKGGNAKGPAMTRYVRTSGNDMVNLVGAAPSARAPQPASAAPKSAAKPAPIPYCHGLPEITGAPQHCGLWGGLDDQLDRSRTHRWTLFTTTHAVKANFAGLPSLDKPGCNALSCRQIWKA
ncbi:hypothetical protein FQA39_LY19399 [Lamprigera yunnana]|nr:hypothetical protein FQA39_LY19399 [Lamprigera yunnana]